MNSNFTEFAQKINESIERSKQMARDRYGTKKSKKDVISDTVATFVLDNIQQIKPRPRMFKNMLAGKPVSTNMVLDTLGENGILIGSTAFRIAEQLEHELPDNQIGPKFKAIALAINGKFMSESCFGDVSVSTAYLKYFEQDSLSLFLQNGYWFEQIRDTTSSGAQKMQKANCYMGLQAICDDPFVLLFVHDTLKLLFFKDYITADLEILNALKDSYGEHLKNDFEDYSKQEQKQIMLNLAALSTAVDEIEKIMSER